MEIVYLCDHLGVADTVARWIYDAFIKDIRADLSYEQVLTAVRDCHKAALPIRLIAMIDGQCVGTVSLVQNDLPCRAYTPWLASLYVDKPFRNRQIGEQLIDAVKDIAKSLGYAEVFLRTEYTSGYYERLGWQFIESCEDAFRLKPDVFRFPLQ